jgi:ribosomal protein L23
MLLKLELSIIRENKSQFRKGRFEGRTARYKKAIITLKEGEKIELLTSIV